MALDVAALTAPLPGPDPCGPDLDAIEDAEFLALINLDPLPAKWRDAEGRPFDPAAPAYRQALEKAPGQLARLFARTRDLRLFVFHARYAIARRNARDFCEALAVIDALLEKFWDGVHPRADEGRLIRRVNEIDLIDTPTARLSLERNLLLTNQRGGAVALRSIELAAKADGQPDGKIVPFSREQIVAAIAESGEAIAETRALYDDIARLLNAIRNRFIEKTDAREFPSFKLLLGSGDEEGVVVRICKLFEEAAGVSGEDEEAAQVEGSGGSARAGRIRSSREARDALQVVLDYFRRREPSSPCLPLLAQARALQGKSFIEALEALAPNSVANARFMIGEAQFFSLSVKPLGNLPGLAESAPDYFEPPAESPAPVRSPRVPERQPEPAPAKGSAGEIATTHDAGADDVGAGSAASRDTEHEHADSAGLESGENGRTDDGSVSEIAAAGHDESEIDTEEAARTESFAMPEPAQRFVADTRAQALSLVIDIKSYFCVAEPSSPIPWLLDQARELAEKDFISVLQSVFKSGEFLMEKK